MEFNKLFLMVCAGAVFTGASADTWIGNDRTLVVAVGGDQVARYFNQVEVIQQCNILGGMSSSNNSYIFNIESNGSINESQIANCSNYYHASAFNYKVKLISKNDKEPMSCTYVGDENQDFDTMQPNINVIFHGRGHHACCWKLSS